MSNEQNKADGEQLAAKTARFYLSFRDAPPTTMDIVIRNGQNWLKVILILSASYAALSFTGAITSPALAILILGTVLGGYVLRDFEYAHSIAKQWPYLEAIIDWQKAEKQAVDSSSTTH